MIAKYGNLILETTEVRQVGHLIRVSGKATDKSGRVTVFENWLIDPSENFWPLIASKIEKRIITKALNHPKPAPPKKPIRKPTYWRLSFDPPEFFKAADSIEFSVDSGEVICKEDGCVYVKSFARPKTLKAIITIKRETWSIPLPITDLKWVEASELPCVREERRPPKRRRSPYEK